MKIKGMVKRYIILLVALFVSAISYNLFLNPLKIVTGGTNGLSILFEELFYIDPSLFILGFSIITFIIGLFILGWEKIIGALTATFIYPLFVALTLGVTDYIIIDTNDMFVISIFIGIITGIVSGVIIKINSSQGGVSLICQALADILKISVSQLNLFVNAVIVLAGGFFFGFSSSLYAIIILYITSIIMDKIILGTSENKVIYIKTDKVALIKDYIINVTNCGVTEFEAISGNSGNEKKFLMTVVTTRDYLRITEYIRSVDKNIFFTVTDAYQASLKQKWFT